MSRYYIKQEGKWKQANYEVSDKSNLVLVISDSYYTLFKDFMVYRTESKSELVSDKDIFKIADESLLNSIL